MKRIHTIYGASTTTLSLTDFEIVQISENQNTKRIVNAFLPTKMKHFYVSATKLQYFLNQTRKEGKSFGFVGINPTI